MPSGEHDINMYNRKGRHTESCPDGASFKRTLIDNVKAMSLRVLIFCENQKMVKRVVNNTTGILLDD
jgi:hypothetical protein